MKKVLDFENFLVESLFLQVLLGWGVVLLGAESDFLKRTMVIIEWVNMICEVGVHRGGLILFGGGEVDIVVGTEKYRITIIRHY